MPLARPSPAPPTISNASTPPHSASSHPPGQNITTGIAIDATATNSDSGRPAASTRVTASPLVDKKRPYLPTPRWNPANHTCFPDSFKKSALAVLGLGLGQRQKFNGCGNGSGSGRSGLAHSLPSVLWIEVLSFTTRGWFEPKPSAESKLATRLAIESKARVQAETAAASAQAKLKAAVKELAEYKALAQRLHGQLRDAHHDQQSNGQHPPSGRRASSSSDQGASGGGGPPPPRRFGLVSNLLDRHLSTFFGHPSVAASSSSQASAAAVEAAVASASDDDDDGSDDDDDDDGEDNDISFGNSSNGGSGNGNGNGNGYHVTSTDGDGDGGFEESEDSDSDASSDDTGHHDGPFETSMELAGV